MIKPEKTVDVDIMDFDINPTNYNPWEEYKRIYSEVLSKGRKYFIV